jgi:hypothetical protein
MSDLTINPTGLPNYNVGTRVVPQYLVSLEGKGSNLFLATKFDETSNHYAKFVGFFVEGNKDDVAKNYQELISTTDVSNFVEVLIPYTRILNIRNLIYKHKQK